ncbi:MAG: response regulator [candidate division KSB1 bacterium]|nr:response regulator [candidate division KSB1 bacterium]MDZ7314048.1 response regulator [candidate division KSB1 bacterium]
MQANSKRKKQKEKPAAAIAPHVLLAEDDHEMRALLARVLRKAGYEVTECSNGVELLEHLGSYFLPDEEHEEIDLIISDIRMPGVSGLEILEGLSKHDDFTPFILITAFGDTETHAQAERFGALAMFDKPFDIDDLLAKVRKIAPPSA